MVESMVILFLFFLLLFSHNFLDLEPPTPTPSTPYTPHPHPQSDHGWCVAVTWCFTPSQPLRLYQGEAYWYNMVRHASRQDKQHCTQGIYNSADHQRKIDTFGVSSLIIIIIILLIIIIDPVLVILKHYYFATCFCLLLFV